MKKNKIKISTAIPASLSEFEEKSNSHLTTATLRVFHSGETADGRIITEKLASKIADTIGGTPVVARYDEDTDDFIGHYHTQSVFGYVPEDAEVWTEEDETSNSKWLVTKVKLFTERKDVGVIAKKIIGQAQSLELNADTLEYQLFYEEGNDYPKVHLTGGDLIGLSVLGAEQNPAFTGSGFFEVSENRDMISELISKYNNMPSEILVETGGETMEKEKFERQKDEDELVTTILADIKEEEEEIDPEVPEIPEEPEVDPGESETEIPEDPEIGEHEEPGISDNDIGEEDDSLDPNGDLETKDEEIVEETPEVNTDEELEVEGDAKEDDAGLKEVEEEVGMESEAKEISTNEAALNMAERAELEGYRRENKINIINSYAEYLSEDILQSFIDEVDNYDLSSLEKEVAFAGMKTVKEGKVTIKEKKQNTSFTFVPSENKSLDAVSEMIKDYN